ncbi:type II toxin-antitoxin system Phd/YefM family antitoxin [Synechococcus sp. PCC 7336]|uniref:type II toxin-antitoxin system Phd/YefM family antitoxin n=1 Tax=Synechococcus sp. PCC 7336 TaxID=195250 RepID=UPI00034B74E8|nr:type II toxin-antitoxin system Phd/YefM family antitoxin [Synechococcus sp. PCC 7336]
MQTISSRDFNQDVGKAKRATEKGPVFITDRGKPAHVLLTVEEYYKLIGATKTVADLLAMPESADIDFDPERTAVVAAREVDLQ